MEIKKTFDFYNQTYLKTYNLDDEIRYQLRMLDSLDAFSRQHSENVAIITSNLCNKLHCSRGFTEYCIICAYLHDIGKLYIPEKILQKPSKLTDEEFEIMKQHTTLGYQICMKNLKLRPYYAGPYYHHEALDGTGYPQGLTKPKIPYEAQIIRVADEYDALVSKRQYKTHIGISDALKIIVENTQPSPNAPKGQYRYAGKNNKAIVNKLMKVVIDDVEYEISCTLNYVDFLKDELKRYQKIKKYINKRNSLKKEEDRRNYDEFIKMFLKSHETIDNIDEVYQEALDTYNSRKDNIKKLYDEIKIIKKLKV